MNMTEGPIDLAATFRLRRYKHGEWHPLHTDTYDIEDATLVATLIICELLT
jgi:hypothetical protein